MDGYETGCSLVDLCRSCRRLQLHTVLVTDRTCSVTLASSFSLIRENLMRAYKNLAAKIGGLLLALTIVGTSLPAFAVNDCDLDNDNITDASCCHRHC
ncbi:hypothetical protein ALP36_05047, partial [Pseudomonas syringae pv. coriandricola]